MSKKGNYIYVTKAGRLVITSIRPIERPAVFLPLSISDALIKALMPELKTLVEFRL